MIFARINMLVMVKAKILKSFVAEVFEKMGCYQADAEQAADILVRAELRGINTHGVVRLVEYFNLWKNNRVKVKPDIKILYETLSTALMDGDKGFGLVVAPKAMKLAIEKAKKAGTGWVSVRNSYHYGIAGYYAMMALEKNMIGISMTNANPLVAPTYSKKPLLGTNPIAVAIPAGKEFPFVADFATAPISRGKLDKLNENDEKVPEGLLQDRNGKNTTYANILTEGGSIKTLGGDKDHGGHKGYCLSALVDILSAVLSGANFGPLVVPTLSYLPGSDEKEDKGIGHFFGAIRIDAFRPADEFKAYMDSWIREFRKAKPVDSQEAVLVPGDPERLSEERISKTGIEIPVNIKEQLNTIAGNLNIRAQFF